MKLIDLFIKIANGEELPEKIIFKNELYILKKWENIEETDYCCESIGNLLGGIYLTNLNEEVQIIEDTPKEDKRIDKLDLSDWWEITSSEDCKPEMLAKIFNKNAKAFSSKINEIIDKINGE